jgi:hypothetical protein
MPDESFVMGDFTDLFGKVEAEGITFEVWDGGRVVRLVFADGSSWVGDGPLVQAAVTPKREARAA